MRLIDADELINQGYEIVVDGLQYDTCNKSIDIDNIPTAYSVDKVVEELESFAKLAEDRWTNGTSKYAYQEHKCWVKAIEIVKQGVVTDYVCEWRLCDEEANVYDTSCRNPHILIEGTPKENNYEYCPYCGKKIKEVE